VRSGTIAAMTYPQNAPAAIREIENLWVPMPNGTRLAARIWLPEDAESNPVPAILEYIPYRKRDRHASQDLMHHPYFAAHGYAAIRLDLRGAGDSDGIWRDEYLAQEQDDGAAAIAWIADQPWCSGTVGMIGLSWGGFSALQVASRRPPALKAIVSICASDDRYADDMHYMGGCLLNDTMVYGATLFAQPSAPPDPALVGDGWRDVWRQRLEASPLQLVDWITHQTRDDYWKQGSVCENYGDIECAVLAVSGWPDGYCNAVPRLLENLPGPRQGLIGPWGHNYPNVGKPGPAIGFLQECLGWWDHWLKGVDNGVMDQPMLRAWMQASEPPRASYEERQGRWVAEEVWPSPNIEPRVYCLNDGGLGGAPGPAATLTLSSPLTLGIASGEWDPYGAGADMPVDQRGDDGGSLVFDTAPLEDSVEILGRPWVTLELAVDRPSAMVAVRLCDVFPDGTSARVTYGLLNLTHRGGHDQAEPLEPGRRYTVRVKLDDVGYAFPPGHRIRVAVSTSLWPIAWPSPEIVTLSLVAGAGRLELPVRPASTDNVAPPRFEPAESSTADGIDVLRESSRGRTGYWTDPVTGRTEITVLRDGGAFAFPAIGRRYGVRGEDLMSITPGDPLSAWTEAWREVELGGEDWSVTIKARTRLSASRVAFTLTGRLEAYDGEAMIFERDWDETIPRNGV